MTFVFFITDILFSIAIMVVWEFPWWVALAFFVVFGALDGVYLSATLNKVEIHCSLVINRHGTAAGNDFLKWNIEVCSS